MALTVVLLACQQAAGAEVDAGEAITYELATRYGATADWDKEFNYTLQLRERLVTGAPVAFTASVDDIWERDGVHFIRFINLFPTAIIWELDCSRGIVDQILLDDSNNDTYLRFLDEYAVVANIEAVSKLIIGLEPAAFSENVDDLGIEVYHPDFWVAKGSCVDIAYIPWK